MNALDIFSDEVSYFENRTTVIPTSIMLSRWIELCTTKINSRLVQIISEIRATEDKKQRDNLKALLPSISPSAVISTRSNRVAVSERVNHYSGWLQFDVDFSQNTGIDAEYYREQVKKIVYVAFCGLSASGRGIWGLVKVTQPDRLKDHFKQLQLDFASREVYIDPANGSNPFHLRSYSFDPNAYIAKTFRIYDRIHEPNQNPKQVKDLRTSTKYSKDKTFQRVSDMARVIIEQGVDIAPDYERYRNLGFAIVNEYGEKGRQLFHAICSPSAKYRSREADKLYDSCLKSNKGLITIGTFFHYCKEAGVNVG